MNKINQINNCCGVFPSVVQERDPDDKNDDYELIECYSCGRIVWGAQEDGIKRWNAGDNDEDENESS